MNAGCQDNRTIGSVGVPVELESEPEGATAYLVDLEYWNQNGGEALLSRRDAKQLLSRFRVSSKPTPVSTVHPPYRYIYVCELDGRFEYEPVLIKDQASSMAVGQRFRVQFR
jgi:hypothetical protein